MRFPTYAQYCSPCAEKIGHVKGTQVRCYWKGDTYVGKIHASSKEGSEKLKRKKTAKNIGRGIYLLDMSLPVSAATGWWARFGGPQGRGAAHSLLGSALGSHSGRSGFSVALLCQAGETHRKELLKPTIPKSLRGPAAHPASLNKEFFRSPTANICRGGGYPLPCGSTRSVVHISWLLVICRFCSMSLSTRHPDLRHVYTSQPSFQKPFHYRSMGAHPPSSIQSKTREKVVKTYLQWWLACSTQLGTVRLVPAKQHCHLLWFASTVPQTTDAQGTVDAE